MDLLNLSSFIVSFPRRRESIVSPFPKRSASPRLKLHRNRSRGSSSSLLNFALYFYYLLFAFYFKKLSFALCLMSYVLVLDSEISLIIPGKKV